MKRMGCILVMAMALLVLAKPCVVMAQDASTLMRAQRNANNPNDPFNTAAGNGYGNNPYNNQSGDGTTGGDPNAPNGQNQQDSTKKKRIKKPLESYYFNDSIRALPNFEWNVSRDYNTVKVMPIDTTLADWRLDYPFYRKGVGDMTIGSLGQASQPTNYFERPDEFDFTFTKPYYVYNYTTENVPFYNSKKPYMNMTYRESGQKRYREEDFAITLAQNVNPSTGFNVNYKARGTKGKYDWSRTKNHNLSLAGSHTGKRYSVHAAYVNSRHVGNY